MSVHHHKPWAEREWNEKRQPWVFIIEDDASTDDISAYVFFLHNLYLKILSFFDENTFDQSVFLRVHSVLNGVGSTGSHPEVGVVVVDSTSFERYGRQMDPYAMSSSGKVDSPKA